MRVLGLDIGERRIGVAVSDPQGRVATPLCVLDASVLGDSRAMADLAAEYEVERIIVGLPVSLGGDEGPQAKTIRTVGMRIAEETGVAVEFTDERLTSAEASRVMGLAGLSEKEKRGRVDMVAAALLLQCYLDRRRVQEASCADPDGTATSPESEDSG